MDEGALLVCRLADWPALDTAHAEAVRLLHACAALLHAQGAALHAQACTTPACQLPALGWEQAGGAQTSKVTLAWALEQCGGPGQTHIQCATGRRLSAAAGQGTGGAAPCCAMAEVTSKSTRGRPPPPESAGALTLTRLQEASSGSSAMAMASGSRAARCTRATSSACSALQARRGS